MKNVMLLYAHHTDNELAEKILAGQKFCFEVLVRRHAASLYRVARMYSFSQYEAEELMSKAFVTVFQTLAEHQYPVSFRTWLSKQMINHCMSHRKVAQKQDLNIYEPSCAAARSAQHYERIIANRGTTGSLEACIEHLPVPLRSVYILIETDGYSIKEASYLLNTSEENIRMRLNKAKSSLRKSLRRWYQYTDIYHLDQYETERIVSDIMSCIDEQSDVPAGVPCY
jgi:RNA polymerase sigma-70 factor (ECF subfamily)